MKVEGSCHCGQVTFEAEIDPAGVRICHCTDCQILSGSAFRVIVHASKFALRSGNPKIYIKTADSGNKRAQAFCADCGTQLYATSAQNPKVYGIRVGTLMERADLTPTRQIWQRSALGWVNDLETIESVPGQ